MPESPLSKNEVTGKVEPSYSRRKYILRCIGSYLICSICCFLSLMVMLYYYDWEKWTYEEYGMDSYTAMVPGRWSPSFFIQNRLVLFHFWLPL